MGKTQIELNKKYRQKHPEHARYLRNKSNAKTFIRKYAQLNDLNELIEMINTRKSELKDIDPFS
ncbi:hypothetical protein HU830_07945 [Lactobacillus sp. DCY120]|uniref:Uncharacterized protein n=1 Tax=Bombilactobacillus apium TaxID=2675299 RepID=A0A850R8K2_9LACO|nr:hypothetical protein [Bombilactobacillus apium]NVY97052.1 hypothetical protein [Bombilactobacillus apium]